MGRKIIADGVYKPLAGFVTRLTENITYKTTYLPIDEVSYQILLNNLAEGDYSFLEIRDGNAVEVVKVINFCDKIVIERGQELTKPLSFRCGIGVAFVKTMQGVKDTVCQLNENDCNEV